MVAQSNQGGADFPWLAIPRFAEQLNGKAQWQVIAVCQPARQGQGVEKPPCRSATMPFPRTMIRSVTLRRRFRSSGDSACNRAASKA